MNKVLITGGIGDFLVLDSFFTVKQKKSIEEIYWATRARSGIQEILTSLGEFYPKLCRHRIVWDDFKNFCCFFYKIDVFNFLRTKGIHSNLDDVTDVGINALFPTWGKSNFKGSSFLKLTINTDKFHLPSKYFTLCPASVHRDGYRFFEPVEWDNIIRFLESRNIPAVVLFKGLEKIPEHPLLLNFMNRTTMGESVGILKRSCGYIGIDSNLSILAAQFFNADSMIVKSVNFGHLYKYKYLYYAPLNNFSFLRPNFYGEINIKPYAKIKHL